MKPGIKPIHVLSYYLMIFTIIMIVQVIISFLIFILGSPEYYNVPDKQVAQTSGDCGFYAEIVVMLFDLVLGVIFDVFGRKIPTVAGLIVAGISLIITPYFSTIYPSFLIIRIFMSLGTIPALNTPLLPDYLFDQSLGLGSAYQFIVSAAAAVFSTTGLLEIKKNEDIKWIFIGIGTYSICVGIFLIFTIKEMNQIEKSSRENKKALKQKLRKTITEFVVSFKEDAGFFVAMFGSFCVKLTALTCSLFGSLLIIANEKNSGNPDYQNDAQTKIQYIFLIGNVLQVPFCLVLGYLSDKTRMWYLLASASAGVIILSTITLLSKIVKKESRGTLFSVYSLAGSVGVLLINKLGGYLYDNVAHEWPFLLTLISFSVFFIVTLILGFMNKLKV
ncbi:UNKNOWN [Stylonychia lemnae]|uniref:Major facilitator superfamily protein n=1 Tax=Stylonychia lemnae TaxID=5949 RepID=A0A078B5L6_STYLE|nr:UNKNOWN [Stylonychia lemnae]|eukprot:CDW88597.1 UNKNOWN [Stylonychia lemnae]